MENSEGRLHFAAGIDNSAMKRDAQETQQELRNISRTAVQEGDKIDQTFKNVGKTIAGVFAVEQAKEFVVQVAKIRGEFQQLEIAFTTMLGSADKANDLMNQLIKTAATTPFNMSDVANGAKQLLAYGVAADEVNNTLIRLGDIAAGLSIPLNDLVYLYGTTMTQGRLYTQDLRQFMGRGIPLAEELAKQFGVTKDKVGELVTAGKVGFPEVKKAIEDLTNEGSKFGGLMEAQSKSISGQISNIEDAIEQMYNEIGKKTEGVISDTLGGVSVIIENWEKIGKVLLTVIAAYGAYKAALLAVWAAQKLASVWGTVQAFASLTKEVTSAKDAMLLFNMATKANPLGLVIGALTAAVAAFALFNNQTTEAAQMSQKFGEKAATAINRVNTLSTALGGLTQGTQAHKQVVDELNGILENYGATQIKEGDNIDAINEKRTLAIELIKQEAIERQRLNGIQTASDTYAQGIADAQAKLYEKLQNAQTIGKLGYLTDNKEIQQNAQAISMIVGNVVEQNINLIAGKTGEEYEKGQRKLFAEIQKRMRAIGISEETIASSWMSDNLFNHQNIVLNYTEAVARLKEEQDRTTDATNKWADAEQKAASKTTTLNDRVKATEKSLSKAEGGVHGLYSQIKKLMEQYSDNNIGFHIKFDGQVPQWMQKMNIPELQRLAKYFAALGTNMKDGAVVSVNGRLMTKQQVLQRGADYASALEQKQTAADKKKQEEEANKKEREQAAKKAAAEAKQRAKEAERERQRIEDETTERNKQIQQYQDSVKAAQSAAELDIRQDNINLMEDSFVKEKAQIDLNYDRLVAENEKRRKEMVEALKDNMVREWLNRNPNATKKQQESYRAGLNVTDADLTTSQQAGLAEYDKVAIETKAKATKDLYKRLLDEYQDYETRRTKENEKYENDRKALEALPPDYTEREQAIAELERKHKEAIKAINDEEVSKLKDTSSLFVDLFTDAADMSDKQIRKVIKDTEDLLSYLKNTSAEDMTPQFGFTTEQLQVLKNSPEKLKEITEQLKKMKAEATQTNPFKQLAEDLKKLFAKSKDGENKDSIEARLKNLGNSAAACADVVGGLSSKLSEMFEAAGNQDAADAMGTVEDAMSTVSNIGKGFAQGGIIGGVAAAAGEAIGYVTKAFQASARHAAALKQIQKEVTAQQRAYNLAILDESLSFEKASTVLGNLDYAKAVNAVDVLKRAYSELNAEMKGTKEQQQAMRDGHGFFSSLVAALNKQGTALKQTYAGLASVRIKTGHEKTGLFGWGSGRDIYSSILDVYPQLIDKAGKFNKTLAESIINSREFEGEGKEALQYMIDLYDKAEEAAKELKDYLTGIFGEFGNTMSDALVDAFRNGSDAAKAFGDSVKTMLENFGKQMIFSTLFDTIVENASDSMLAVMKNQGKTSEEKFNEYINILDTMTTGILAQQGTYDELMKRYKEMAAAKGIDIFSADSDRTGSAKGIATASQESVDELNGRATAIQGHTYSISENMKLLVGYISSILRSIMNIESETDGMKNRLERIESNSKAVKDTVSDIATKGVKIR